MRGLALLLVCGWTASARADLAELAEAIRLEDPPVLLSQTRAFKNLADLTPHEQFLPYDLNVPFWSDGATKGRWVFIPPGAHVRFSPTNEWKFPAGTLFMKQFNLGVGDPLPTNVRRLETRFTVVTTRGGVIGLTYRWRGNGQDADLLLTNLSESIPIQRTSPLETQSWYYPSRADCVTCHTPLNGGVLGLSARQLNREFAYRKGASENQLLHWARLGLFDSSFIEIEKQHARLHKLAAPRDANASVEVRARSWLDANCAYCHRPGGTVANFDARFDTPLMLQALVNGPVLIDEGIDNARVIAPKDIWRSILFLRINTQEPFKMPPLAHGKIDDEGVALMKTWVESLPGRPALAPPKISPAGADFKERVLVALSHEVSGVVIHFTLDGSAPQKASPVYTNSFELTSPVTVRARAFSEGFTRSIAVQETFIVNSGRSRQ
jgi:uncharacterized repeat protein (TIGR03806 family)